MRELEGNEWVIQIPSDCDLAPISANPEDFKVFVLSSNRISLSISWASSTKLSPQAIGHDVTFEFSNFTFS